jgi:hypothetical protein
MRFPLTDAFVAIARLNLEWLIPRVSGPQEKDACDTFTGTHAVLVLAKKPAQYTGISLRMCQHDRRVRTNLRCQLNVEFTVHRVAVVKKSNLSVLQVQDLDV